MALCTLVVVLGVGLGVGLALIGLGEHCSVGTAFGFSRLYAVAWFPGLTRQPTAVLVQSGQLQSGYCI